jgi:hypothetical protein
MTKDTAKGSQDAEKITQNGAVELEESEMDQAQGGALAAADGPHVSKFVTGDGSVLKIDQVLHKPF